ncbi:amidohydrolase family protein [Brevibacterium metallidurans]|uniref:Amidohydrolase family protein n=1 Tax=Brevibacterium metallidurans TaxID=1482676 RepID=A0ABN0SMJ5_9MICO
MDTFDPAETGHSGDRFVIRGGAVMSLDPAVGDFDTGDVLVDGTTIVEVAPRIDAADIPVIDATGKIVMPGFIDTHHHQFETGLRSFLADGLLFDDGQPHGRVNYFDYILGRFAGAYRPEDVYINTLFGALSQLDCGVTTVLDVSQIHHTPDHSNATVQALSDSGKRAVLGYFEGSGQHPDFAYPGDAQRLLEEHFSSTDQLVTMMMGGEIYLPGYEETWRLGRELGLPVVCHVVGSFAGMRPEFDKVVDSGALGPDNLFIHMTEVSDRGWQAAKDAGAKVSAAVPIELNMRHGTPPLLKAVAMDMQPSLSTDVECTMTADFFTQMRSAMTLQRGQVNQMVLDGAEDVPELATTRDVLRWATVNGAEGLGLADRVGSLTPGKEADILILDAEAINVAPLNNVPGAVVSLMERSNVESVIVAGAVRKWQGRLLDVDLQRLRTQLEASRDHLFDAAGIERDLFAGG